MSLIVEDGTNVPGAESYASVNDADVYFDNRGVTIWSNLTIQEKEQALRRATDYMLERYRLRWKGGRIHFKQPLDWPRQGVSLEDFNGIPQMYYAYLVPYNVVPVEVKNACAELALRASINALNDDLQQNVLEEAVGPITTKYDPNSPQIPRYVKIDQLLAPFLVNGGNNATVKLVRK